MLPAVVQAQGSTTTTDGKFDWDIEMLNTTFNPSLAHDSNKVVEFRYSIPSLADNGKICTPRLYTHDCAGSSDEMTLSSIQYPADDVMKFDVAMDVDRIQGSPFYEDDNQDTVTFDVHFCTRIDCYLGNSSINFYESKYTLTVDIMANFIREAYLYRTLDHKNESFFFEIVEGYFCDHNGNLLPAPDLEPGDAVGYCVKDSGELVYYLHDVTTTTISQYMENSMYAEHGSNTNTRRLQAGNDTNIFDQNDDANTTGIDQETLDEAPAEYRDRLIDNPEPLQVFTEDLDENGRTIPKIFAGKHCNEGETPDAHGDCKMKVLLPSIFYDNVKLGGSAPVILFGKATMSLNYIGNRHLMSVPIAPLGRRRLAGGDGEGFGLTFRLVRKTEKPEDQEQVEDEVEDEESSFLLHCELAAAFILLVLGCALCCVFCVCKKKKKAMVEEDSNPSNKDRRFSNEKTSSFETESHIDVDQDPALMEAGAVPHVATEHQALPKETLQIRKPHQRSNSFDHASLLGTSFFGKDSPHSNSKVPREQDNFDRKPPVRAKSADHASSIMPSFASSLASSYASSTGTIAYSEGDSDLEDALSKALSSRLNRNVADKTFIGRKPPMHSSSEDRLDSQSRDDKSEEWFLRRQSIDTNKESCDGRKTPRRSISDDHLGSQSHIDFLRRQSINTTTNDGADERKVPNRSKSDNQTDLQSCVDFLRRQSIEFVQGGKDERKLPSRSKSDNELDSSSRMAVSEEWFFRRESIGNDSTPVIPMRSKGENSLHSTRDKPQSKHHKKRKTPRRSKSDEVALENLVSVEKEQSKGGQRSHRSDDVPDKGRRSKSFDLTGCEETCLSKKKHKHHKKRKTPKRSKSADSSLSMATLSVASLAEKGLSINSTTCMPPTENDKIKAYKVPARPSRSVNNPDETSVHSEA
jgi:hypothetical protein